jgi:hypothetical protein
MLRQLEWRVRHAVENILSGEYRSAFRGRGMEFDQVVKYEFGDDVRDIDWNVTARLGEPYRKKFVEEREVTLLLVFEDSPSLHFGSGAQSKREALLELAGLVMLLGAVNRDRVGFAYTSPAGNLFREPVRGRGQILHSAATLLACCPLHSAAVVYTLSLHACMQLLLGVSTDHLVGGPALGSNRAWSCAALVAGAAWWGPRVSLVNWSGHDPVACAVHAHLLGCVLPQMTGSLVAGLANLVSALGARRE